MSMSFGTHVSITGVAATQSDGEDEQSSSSSSSASGDDAPVSPSGSAGGDSQRRLMHHSSTDSLRVRAEQRRRFQPKPPEDVRKMREQISAEMDNVLYAAKEVADFHQLNMDDASIPSELALADHLTSVILANNCITAFPSGFFDLMSNLTAFDAVENMISEVPGALFRRPLLEKLLLDHNRLEKLPRPADDGGAPFSLPQLKVLGLSWNDLLEFPIDVVTAAPTLTELYVLENARLQAIPPAADFGRAHLSRGGVDIMKVVMDNRPKLMTHLQHHRAEYQFATFEWNKIYPDRVEGVPYIFLGSLRTTQCLEVYEDLDIGFVLTAARHLEPFIPQGMVWLELPLDDMPTEDPTPFFERACEFIDVARASKKGVLIHCFMGLSRSVAMTISYLISRMGMSRDESLALIRRTRPTAQPNAGFMEKLSLYEKLIKARRS